MTNNEKKKIVIAPDSFKGSMTAAEAGAAIAAGVRRACPDAEIVTVPMADGGEGMLEALIGGRGLTIECEAEDPLGRPVKASYGMLKSGTAGCGIDSGGAAGCGIDSGGVAGCGIDSSGAAGCGIDSGGAAGCGIDRGGVAGCGIDRGGAAVIEMAQASGLTLLSGEERDPLIASTYGTGQLIRDALDRGARDIVLGIGGSATNDGGAGMAQALGYRFLDENGEELPRGGGALLRLARIDASGADARLAQSRFTVACDVDNPLTGKRGASAVFGPQKGATPDMAALLDKALARFADCVRRDLGMDVADAPGAGAAGGLGAGSMAFLGARLRRGVDIVIEATGLASRLEGAALAITGEGRTDSQTPHGKTAHGVAVLARSLGVPVVLISGSLAEGAEEMLKYGVVRLHTLMEGGVTLDEAMRDGEMLLEARAERAAREHFGTG